jgi:hypothetical protein
LLENFIAFEEARGGLVKKIAKYHQVLGVNRAMAAVERIKVRIPMMPPGHTEVKASTCSNLMPSTVLR